MKNVSHNNDIEKEQKSIRRDLAIYNFKMLYIKQLDLIELSDSETADNKELMSILNELIDTLSTIASYLDNISLMPPVVQQEEHLVEMLDSFHQKRTQLINEFDALVNKIKLETEQAILLERFESTVLH